MRFVWTVALVAMALSAPAWAGKRDTDEVRMMTGDQLLARFDFEWTEPVEGTWLPTTLRVDKASVEVRVSMVNVQRLAAQ